MPVIRGTADVLGGVLVRVRLHFSRRELYARRVAGLSSPQPVEADALIDTGSQVTCVEPFAIAGLPLPFVAGGLLNLPATGGLTVAYEYDASLVVVHPSGREEDNLVIPGLSVTATPLNAPGHRVLIGRDVLSRCRLDYDGRAGTFALRY